MNKTITRKVLGAAAVIGAFSLSACATKEFVREEVGALAATTEAELANQSGQLSTQGGQISANQARLGEHDAQLANLDQATREALERATAAGKLAEGKFLYSMVLSDDSVKFPVNGTQLSPEAESRLTELVEKLKAENRNVFLEIQGHTDASGAPSYNERLGQQRAEAVRRFLSKMGVALNRMNTISYGEEQPVAPNNNREARAQNRRVVIVVLS